MRSVWRVWATAGGGLFLPACLILALQAVASHRVAIAERNIAMPDLEQFPWKVGSWKATGNLSLDQRVAGVLKPDAYILRNYVDDGSGTSINVFLAYFKSLQNSYGPHSPRICLPASGWMVRSSQLTSFSIPGLEQAIPVNEYVMEKSNDRILVLYWYQNDRNIWAEEFQAKLRLLPDLIRYRRSDVSLIRLITPMATTVPTKEFASCREFVQLTYPKLAERLQTVR
jgi:EpsI family protein